MTRRLGVLFIGALFAAACVAAASAPAYGQATQTPPAETKPDEAKPEEEKKEEKPKMLWEENTLSAYLETSLVWNRGGRAAATTNGGHVLPSGLGLVGRGARYRETMFNSSDKNDPENFFKRSPGESSPRWLVG
jgi:hypothetical protein